MLGDPAQRRGADAAGRGADRRRPGALPRLLVVLSARPAAAARRAVGAVRAVAAVVAVVRVLCDARPWRCWSGGWRAAAARRRWAALGGVAGGALALAYPSGPHPFPLTLALCLGALLVPRRGRRSAGALTGVAAFWRIEFAAYLGARRPAGVRGARAGWARAALRFAGAAVGDGGGAVRAVRARGRAGRSFDLLVRYPLLDFGDYQSLPFPLDYDGPLNTGVDRRLPRRTRPRTCCCSTCRWRSCSRWPARSSALALRFRREDWWQVAVAVFAVGMRTTCWRAPDAFHTAPLAVMVAVLAAWAARRAPREVPGRRGRSRSRRAARACAALAGLAFAIVEGADRRWLGCAPAARRSRSPSPTACACRERTARDLEARGAGDPGARAARRADLRRPARSDLVTAGNPLLYVLADRPNPTRYDIQAPGVVTSAPVQREIVARPGARPPARRRPRHVARHRRARAQPPGARPA